MVDKQYTHSSGKPFGDSVLSLTSGEANPFVWFRVTVHRRSNPKSFVNEPSILRSSPATKHPDLAT